MFDSVILTSKLLENTGTRVALLERMNISSLTDVRARELASISASQSAVNRSLADVGSTTSSNDSAAISGPAQLLSKLSELQRSDPTKLEQVLGQISEALSDEASTASDAQSKQMLSGLASQFASAAKTGDLSSLAPAKSGPAGGGGPGGAGGPPPGGRPPGGAPPGGGAARGGSSSKASSESSSSDSTSSSEELDPADTNKDGSVSASEKLAYLASQAETADSDKASAAYLRMRAPGEDSMQATLSRLMSIVDRA